MQKKSKNNLDDVSPDEIWNALRMVCCSSKPPESANRIVMLSLDNVKKAFNLMKHIRGIQDGK